jgi:Ribonuclease G/E
MDEKLVYLEKMQAQLNDWTAKIDALIVKAEKAGAAKKAVYQEQIITLQAKKKVAEEKLQILKVAGADAWRDAKQAMDKISGDLRTAWNKFLHGEEEKGT